MKIFRARPWLLTLILVAATCILELSVARSDNWLTIGFAVLLLAVVVIALLAERRYRRSRRQQATST